MSPPAPSAAIPEIHCGPDALVTETPPVVHCRTPFASAFWAKMSQLPFRKSFQATIIPPLPSTITRGAAVVGVEAATPPRETSPPAHTDTPFPSNRRAYG